MLPFERSAPLPPVSPRSAPQNSKGTVQTLIQAGLARSDRAAAEAPPAETYPSKEAGRTPPVPATFLEPAAGGAFELFPRRQLPRGPHNGGQGGAGALIQAALNQPAANPLMAGLLNARRDEAPRQTALGQAAPDPAEAPRLRRSA